jgi:hypothetical protein
MNTLLFDGIIWTAVAIFAVIIIYFLVNRIFYPIHLSMIKESVVRRGYKLQSAKIVQTTIQRGVLNGGGTCYDVEMIDKAGAVYVDCCIVSVLSNITWIDGKFRLSK